MINILFSDIDICALRHGRLHHPHPRVRKKMDVLYLKSQGIPHKDICRIVDITKPTLTSYLKAYREGGIEHLKEVNFYKPKSVLEDYEDIIANHFEQHPIATLAEARHEVEKLTGIRLSTSQIGKFLKRFGLRRRKTGSIPGKAITDEKIKEQEDFLEQKLDPNSASVCQLLIKISAMNIAVPVILVLDNARYQRCKLVQEYADSLNIELLFLPSYSPNLNLIERFWKFVKNQCLYSKYYPTFDEFKAAILDCIDGANVKHKEKLDSLLTLNFQSFKKVKVMNC